MTSEHDDQLNLLSALPRGHRIHFAVLADRVVAAQVDATIVTPGALNPVAVRVLEIVGNRKETTLAELAAEFGNTAEIRAVIAEIVHVLERAGQVQVGDLNNGGAITTRQSANWIEFDVELASHDVHFLPPAQLIGRRLHGSRATPEHLPIFVPPWDELYGPEALKVGIARAYTQEFHRFKRASDIAYSHEVLQRARLQRSKPYPKSLSVKVKGVCRLYVFHRCYIYETVGSSGFQWVVIVRQYLQTRLVGGYTNLMSQRIKDSAFLDALLAKSVEISR